MLSPLQRRRISARIVEPGACSDFNCLVVGLGHSGGSLTDLADEKVSFFDAAILIFSPLAGLHLRAPASP